MDTVLSVRYRGELCYKLQVSEDSLLSLIQLIVQITRLYVCSIKAYLQVAKQTLPEVEFLQEFIYRYSMLRNSIMELDVIPLSFRKSFSTFFNISNSPSSKYFQATPCTPGSTFGDSSSSNGIWRPRSSTPT